MTQFITVKNNKLPLFLLLIIGVLIVFILWKSCGGQPIDNPRIAQMQKESDSIINRLASNLKITEDSLKDVKGQKELTDSFLSDAAKDLDKMFAENNKLRKQHDQQPKPIPFDSSNSIVSNEYVHICDDCFLHLKKLEDTVKTAKVLLAKREALWNETVRLKDKQYTQTKESLNNMYGLYNKLSDECKKQNKPRASLSAGIEYNYSPSVSEVGAYISFRTKRGQEIGAGFGGNTLSSYYFSIRAGAKIF